MTFIGEPPQVGWILTTPNEEHHTLLDEYRCVHGVTNATRFDNSDETKMTALDAAAKVHGEVFGCECIRRLADMTRAEMRAR